MSREKQENHPTTSDPAGRSTALLGLAAYARLIDDLKRQRQLAAQSGIKPEWIRLPAPRQRCPWTQLSRTGMMEVVVSPALAGKIPVKIVKAVREGKTRGVVMIHFDSLMSYFESLATPNTKLTHEGR